MPGYVDPLPPRTEFVVSLTSLSDSKVVMRSYDRISIDDVVLHLVRRELFRLAGGADPGDDLNTDVKDEVIRDGFITR